MVIFKKDKGGSHGVGGKQLQMEIFPGSQFKTGLCWSLSLSREDRKKTEKKVETERNPSLQSPPATDSEAGLCTQTSCTDTHNRFSLVHFGLDPTHPAQTQPGCSRRSRQSSAGGTASVSRTTRFGT